MFSAPLRGPPLRLFFRRILRLYPNPAEAPPELKQAVAYLWKNRRPMNYVVYRKAGFPISNCTVESAAKTLIQQRMKQAGMRWSRFGAQAMLALRARLSATAGTKSPNALPHPRTWDAPETQGNCIKLEKNFVRLPESGRGAPCGRPSQGITPRTVQIVVRYRKFSTSWAMEAGFLAEK